MPLSMSLSKLLDQADVVEKAIKEFENLGVRSELSVRLVNGTVERAFAVRTRQHERITINLP